MARWRDNLNWVLTPVLAVAGLLVWEAYVRWFDVSPMILPRPESIGRALLDLLASPRTYFHAWITIEETLAGFFIAVVVGVALGTVLAKVRWLERTLSPFIVGLQVMPKIALVPLFIVWFGFGLTSKIVMAAVLAFFPVMTNTVLGIKSIEAGHRDVMLGLNAGRWATFRDLDLPAALPYILTGMEVGMILAIVGAIVGEYLGGNIGLGQMAVATLNAFDVQGMFAVIVLLTVMGFALYFAVVVLRRYLTPWHQTVAQRKDV
jgi:NitT/TauT family transport system permease protein